MESIYNDVNNNESYLLFNFDASFGVILSGVEGSPTKIIPQNLKVNYLNYIFCIQQMIVPKVILRRKITFNAVFEIASLKKLAMTKMRNLSSLRAQ